MTGRRSLPLPQGPFPPTEEMLAQPVPEAEQKRGADQLRAAWKTPTGWRYWSAVNNSEVGTWYSLTGSTSFSPCMVRR